MTLNEQLHNSATHAKGFDPACPVCNPQRPETVNAHVHSTFAQALNSWAMIGNGLYVRTAPRKNRRSR